MTSRAPVLVVLALGAMPLHATTFFHVGDADRTGMAVEVQRGIIAGVIVSQPEGRTPSTATFAGPIALERSGGDVPFSTILTESAQLEVATLPGGAMEAALYRRRLGIGLDTTEFQWPDHTVVLDPLGFNAANTLEDWAGRYAFVRTNAGGLVDATDLDFAARVEVDGGPALMGTTPDGRAALLLRDPATGIIAGAYEPVIGQPVAFALLGTLFTAERAAGLWVAIGPGGAWVGGDQELHLQRLGATSGLGKAAATSVMVELHQLARRVLADAMALSSTDPGPGGSR